MCVNAPGASRSNLQWCSHEPRRTGRVIQGKRVAPVVTYWAEAVAIGLLIDLILTIFVVAVAGMFSWVARGFETDRTGIGPARASRSRSNLSTASWNAGSAGRGPFRRTGGFARFHIRAYAAHRR